MVTCGPIRFEFTQILNVWLNLLGAKPKSSVFFSSVGREQERSSNGPESATRSELFTWCGLPHIDVSHALLQTHADENMSQLPRGKVLQHALDVKPRTALGTIGGGNNLYDRHAPHAKVSLMFLPRIHEACSLTYAVRNPVVLM